MIRITIPILLILLSLIGYSQTPSTRVFGGDTAAGILLRVVHQSFTETNNKVYYHYYKADKRFINNPESYGNINFDTTLIPQSELTALKNTFDAIPEVSGYDTAFIRQWEIHSSRCLIEYRINNVPYWIYLTPTFSVETISKISAASLSVLEPPVPEPTVDLIWDNTLLSAKNVFQTELIKGGKFIAINHGGTLKQKGITIGYAPESYFNPSNSTDAFRIVGTDTSLAIMGRSTNAIINGIYWYLKQLGYRFYKPNPLWHIIPTVTNVYRNINYTGSPSFLWRRMQTAHGYPTARVGNEFEYYLMANLQNGNNIGFYHSYQGIINRNKETFKAHPEYFARQQDWQYLINTNTVWEPTKFNVDNEDLVQLVIRDALRITNINTPSISLEPSDGDDWNPNSQIGNGSPSDQTFYLANRVAAVFDSLRPRTRIGVLAYNTHVTPPSFPVNKRVVIVIAEGYNTSSYTIDQVYEIWKGKGHDIGTYEYGGVVKWDYDMPGQPIGSHPWFSQRIKYRFNVNQSRYYGGETVAGWISRGLGHYLQARTVWDVNENLDTIQEEFYTKCFGVAKPYIKQLFNEWDSYRQLYPLEGNLYDWYSLCKKADSVAVGDSNVLKRIYQIKVYLHFSLLYKNYLIKNKPQPERDSLLRFIYRYLESGIMIAHAVQQYESQNGDPNYFWMNANAPWKAITTPYTSTQVDSIVDSDMARFNPLVKAVPTEWPVNFQPATTATNLTSIPFRAIGILGKHYIVFNITDPTGAKINLYNLGWTKAKKALYWAIYEYNSGISEDPAKLKRSGSIPFTGTWHSLDISNLPGGAYILSIMDYREVFDVSFTGKVAYGIVGSNELPMYPYQIWPTLYFYHGSRDSLVINTTATQSGMRLVSPTNRIINLPTVGFNIIPVEAGEKEGVWRFEKVTWATWGQYTYPFFCPDSRFMLKPDTNE